MAIDNNLNQNVPSVSSTPKTDTNRYGMSGQNPTPGGPNPIQVPQQVELRQALQTDIAKGQTALKETQKRLGVKPQKQFGQSFQAKGMKIGGVKIAASEFKRAEKVRNDAINDVMRNFNFGNQQEMTMFKEGLNDRLKRVQLDLTKAAVEAQKRLDKANASQSDKRKTAAMFGSIAGTVVGAVIGTYLGPAGTAAGASVGGAVGGAVGGYGAGVAVDEGLI